MNPTDFSYSLIDGMYSLYANTEEAGRALSEIMAQNQDSIKFFGFEFQSLKRQLRSAGYTLSKDKQCKMSVDELLTSLADLAA